MKAYEMFPGKSVTVFPSPDHEYYRLEVDGTDVTKAVDDYDMMPDATESCLFCREMPCCISVGEQLWNALDDRYLELMRSGKSPGQIRFGMYRLAHQHVNGWMGSGNRTPLPHCVVELIKSLSPDPNGEYVGFKEE